MASRRPFESIPVEALLADLPPGHVEIAERLRSIVLEAVPEAEERVRTGWRLIGYDLPVARHGVFFAWIWPEPEHVHLGFPMGTLMADPEELLHGAGITKRARWLTYTAADDVDTDVARRFVDEAARVGRLSRGERLARRQEVEASR